MSFRRADVEQAYSSLRTATDAKDWTAFVDCFTEDCTFVNSVLEQPIRGRDALREYVTAWVAITNTAEWYTIDGDRVVVGWVERPMMGRGWVERQLLPHSKSYGDPQKFLEKAKRNLKKNLSVILPVQVGGTRYRYKFTFVIKDIRLEPVQK